MYKKYNIQNAEHNTEHSKTSPTNMQILVQQKWRIPMKCLDCPLKYKGQTGRTFHNRYKEHIQVVRNYVSCIYEVNK